MANYTPNYNLKKPGDADSYDIADANGNMDIIDGALNTLNSKINATQITGSTKSAVESSLETFGSAMSNGEIRRIWFAIATASAPFMGTTYVGTIERQENRFVVLVNGISTVGQDLEGFYKSGTGWAWQSLNNKVTQIGDAIELTSASANGETTPVIDFSPYRFVLFTQENATFMRHTVIYPVNFVTSSIKLGIDNLFNGSDRAYCLKTAYNSTTKVLTLSTLIPSSGNWTGTVFKIYGIK